MANLKKQNIKSLDQLKQYQTKKRSEETSQEGAISESLDAFELWFIDKWKQIAVGTCIFAAVVAVAIVIVFVYRGKQEKIRNEFANATTVENLQKVIKDYSNNEFVESARLKLAALYVKEEKYDLAREQLIQVAKSAKSEIQIKSYAALNAAYLSEKSGKQEDAVTEFTGIYSNATIPEDIRVEAAYSAMRLNLDLNHVASAGQALATIDLTRASATGMTQYGYWAAKAKALSKQLDIPATTTATPAASDKQIQ